VQRAPTTGLRWTAGIAVVMVTAVTFVVSPSGFAPRFADAWVYLAAGERLNAGHQLYALVPGDRPLDIRPPLWATPLLSPPPIAVVWRPIALIGEPAMALWCLGAIAAALGLIYWGLRYGGAGSLAAVVAFGPFLLYAAFPGNANAYLAPLLALAWRQRHRPWLPALSVVAAAAVKITPVALAPWLLTRRRALWGAVCSVVVVIGAVLCAPNAISDWLASSNASSASPLSVAGLLGTDGKLTALAIIGVCWIAALLARRHERAVFAIGLVGSTFAMPAFYLHSLALLAPLIVLDPPAEEASAAASHEDVPPA